MVNREAYDIAMHRAPREVKAAAAKAMAERVHLMVILCWVVEFGRVLPERIDGLIVAWKLRNPVDESMFGGSE